MNEIKITRGFNNLTLHEKMILKGIIKDETYAQIAMSLDCSKASVRSHVRKIKDKVRLEKPHRDNETLRSLTHQYAPKLVQEAILELIMSDVCQIYLLCQNNTSDQNKHPLFIVKLKENFDIVTFERLIKRHKKQVKSQSNRDPCEFIPHLFETIDLHRFYS